MKVLLLCAHPDDEVFVCGKMFSFIKRHEVHIAWATSGDLFGKGELRERELSLASDVLGVEREHRYLLRFPDMGLVRYLGQCWNFIESLINGIQPTQVFVPAYEGGHPDHDALNFVAHSVWKHLHQSFSLLEFPLYNGTGPFFFLWLRVNSFVPGTRQIEKHLLDTAQIALKSRLIEIYNSQPRSMYPVRLTYWWRRITGRFAETYARIPHDRDYQVRPHPGPLFYERFFNKHLDLTFEEFSQAVADYWMSESVGIHEDHYKNSC